jgi:uncharacterized OB-fold protein
MNAPFPLPDPEWEPTREFFAAAARNELAIPRCEACGKLNWTPPERCRACDDADLRWTAVSGRARLFSWARVERAWVKAYQPIAPYVSGIVTLEEDPAVRLVSLLVDAEPAALRAELPLEAVFRPLPYPDAPSTLLVPQFRPAA